LAAVFVVDDEVDAVAGDERSAAEADAVEAAAELPPPINAAQLAGG